MKQIKYVNPTNINNVSNERIRAYFSVLYCEIIHPVTKEKVQRTGLLSDTHAIIGAANFLPFGSVGEELKRRWEEINKETDEAIKRAKNAPLQDRPIIMDNIISALELYKKMQKNMINVTYPKDPAGLNKVKALANKVMGEWSGFLVWAENAHYCFGGETTNNTPPKPAKKRGRPEGTAGELKDRMIDDADGSKLKKIHNIIAGKKGKDAILVISVCVGYGWMTRPTASEAIKEFGKIFSVSYYNKCMNKKFDPTERAGIIKNLK